MNSVISVKDLSKRFKLYSNNRDRVREWISPFKKQYHHEFWALENVSFDVIEGETLGILGRNGSGKSTLLQIISGVMAQTAGNIAVHGRISALLELGTGFDYELTGRENLYLSGSIMGFSKEEIRQRIPLIEEFAEIGDFIDQPVRVYSSGMYVRLAFAQAIHVDPDILIIDEALAVGDVKFQNKCYRKFNEFKNIGKTVIFVTHATDLVAKHCDRAILLDMGKLIMDDVPNKVINRYLDLLFGVARTTEPKKPAVHNVSDQLKIETSLDTSSYPDAIKEFLLDNNIDDQCASNPTYNQNEHRWGSNQCRIFNYAVFADNAINPLQVEAGSPVSIFVKYFFSKDVNRPIYGFTLKTLDGVDVFGSNSEFEAVDVKPKKNGELAIMRFDLPASLITGEYFINIGLAEYEGGETVPLDRRYDMIHLKVFNPTSRYGIVDLNMSISEIA